LDELEKGCVKEGTGLKKNALFHIQTGGAQNGQPTAIHPRIGIPDANHHTPDARPKECIGAGWRATMVATGFQGHIGRST
jgi:hypothetical protein